MATVNSARADDSVETVIIGAGVVGLACAAVFARRGQRVLVLEKHGRVGDETSSRNSGVIHAGLYYPQGALKTTLCVRGRELLYARAARQGIPHRKLGKLIVAVDAAESSTLEALAARARENGAGALRMLESAELHALEPRVRASAALLSPESGIIDAHALVQAYLAEAKGHGATLALRTTVEGLEPVGERLRVVARTANAEPDAIVAERVINAAGLGAFDIARLAGLASSRLGVAQHLCKGDYWKLTPRLRGVVSHLLYPLPVRAGLGVHLTLDLDGSLRAGPDTEYVSAARYDIDETKRVAFAEAVRRYLPELRDDDLTPDFAGIRPKLHGPETTFHDFVIADAAQHGVPGLYNLLGIESPGLTASEAIAEHVAGLAGV